MIYDYDNLNPALPNQNIGGNYYTPTFADIYESAADFKQDYIVSGLYDVENKIEKIEILYYLLYSRYGNSTIASYDENRFRYNLFSIIFMYGPSWETKLKIQHDIRELAKSDELFDGATMVNNHSYNPSTPPAMNAFEPLPTVNDQSANKRKKPKIEGYASIMGILKSDITAEFLDKFRNLFITIVEPNAPLWYTTTPEEQETLQI